MHGIFLQLMLKNNPFGGIVNPVRAWKRKKMHIRQKINIILIGMLTLGFLAGCSQLQHETALIPMESFFKNPDKTGFQLSPDGNSLALMKPWKNRMNVFIQKIGKPGEKRVTRSTARDVADFFWANNNRIVFV